MNTLARLVFALTLSLGLFCLPAAAQVVDPVVNDCNGNNIPDDVEVGNTDSISTLIPNRFDFMGGDSFDNHYCGSVNNNISDGGGDMYDCGNYLHASYMSQLPYTDNALLSGDGIFGTGSSYFTVKFPALFALKAMGSSSEMFATVGNLGADGSGNASHEILTTTVDSQPYTLYVKRVWNAWDPSINQVMIVPGDAVAAGVTYSWSSNTNDNFHQVSNLFSSGVNTFYYLLVSTAQGNDCYNHLPASDCELEDADLLTIVNAFLGQAAGVTTQEQLTEFALTNVFSEDCNENLVPDECDVRDMTSIDCNYNKIPDECDIANWDGVEVEVDEGQVEVVDLDQNDNGRLDRCEDCNHNWVPDACDLNSEGAVWDLSHYDLEPNYRLCQEQWCRSDEEPIPAEGSYKCGLSSDVNENFTPDECEDDCNANSVPDSYDISTGEAVDCNDNGAPDMCDLMKPMVATGVSYDDYYFWDTGEEKASKGGRYGCGTKLFFVYPYADSAGTRLVGALGEGQMAKDIAVDPITGTVYAIGCGDWRRRGQAFGPGEDDDPGDQNLLIIDPATGLATALEGVLNPWGDEDDDDDSSDDDDPRWDFLMGLTPDTAGTFYGVGWQRFAQLDKTTGGLAQEGFVQPRGHDMSTDPNANVLFSLTEDSFYYDDDAEGSHEGSSCAAGFLETHCLTPEQVGCEEAEFGQVIPYGVVYDIEGGYDFEYYYEGYCRRLMAIAYGTNSEGEVKHYGLTRVWNWYDDRDWDDYYEIVEIIPYTEPEEGDEPSPQHYEGLLSFEIRTIDYIRGGAGLGFGSNLLEPLSADCDLNAQPDECQPDCDEDGIPDVCETDTDGDEIVDDCDECPADATNQCNVIQGECEGLCSDDYPELDEDGDGVTNCQEIEDETDACDSGSFVERLLPTACSGPNGYFEQYNIATVVNKTNRTMKVHVQYRDLFGVLKGAADYWVGALLKVDIDVNALGLVPDTYGTFCVYTDATKAGEWTGGLRLYKRRAGAEGLTRWLGADQVYDYALNYEFRNAQTGSAFAALNTNGIGTSGTGTVANWVRLTDGEPEDGKALLGMLYFYNAEGKEVASTEVALPDGGRFDFPGHVAVGESAIGMAKFVPTKANAKYYIETSRYFYEGAGASTSNFYTAFPVRVRPLTGAALTSDVSSDSGQLAVVEVINGRDTASTAQMNVFGEDGAQTGGEAIWVPANGSAHRFVTSGLAGLGLGLQPRASAEVSGPAESLSTTTVIYSFDANGALTYAYAPPFVEGGAASQLTDFNSFIGHDNTLRLTNSTDGSRLTTIDVVNYDSTVYNTFDLLLDPRTTHSVSLNDYLPAGMETYGTVLVSGEKGVVVRNDTSKTDAYVVPLPGSELIK